MSGLGAPAPTAGTTAITVSRAAAISPPVYTETLPRRPESASRGRRLTVAALSAWGLSELEDAGNLIVSELVANAVEHTACPSIRVTVSRPAPGRVRIAVTDTSSQVPTPGTPSDEDEHGRGLLVVASLAADAGTDLLRRGKRVWAELVTEENQREPWAQPTGGCAGRPR